MKNIIQFIVLIGLLQYSCTTCEEIEATPCGDRMPNSEYCGYTVATCYGENNADVAVIFDTRDNASAPRGDDWGNTISANHPPNWNAGSIGQIYGITIDAAENIYFGSSDVYFYDGLAVPSSNISRPYPCTQIFKCDPLNSWNAVPFSVLPNTNCNAGNGIGNLAYDKYHNQLFATNLEDGKIYRIDLATGIPIESYDPWLPDSGNAGIENRDELIWGIAVNNDRGSVKIYFTKVSALSRELYSLALVAGAFPSPGSEQVEISGLPGNASKFTDLAISGDGTRLLLAERGGPHAADAFSADLLGSNWSLTGNSYFVGAHGSERNSSGGVDFFYTNEGDNRSKECDEQFWVSANAMHSRGEMWLYGIQGINYSGNTTYNLGVNTSQADTDLFIDFDQAANLKSGIGDVEVFDCIACGDPCSLNDKIN